MVVAKDILTMQYYIIQRDIANFVEILVSIVILIGLSDLDLLKEVYLCIKTKPTY